MRITTILLILGLAEAAAARLPPNAAPRATDLLTAERAAERAKRLLKLPAKHGAGWRQGGGGFDAPPERPDPPPPVRIEIHPGRQPRGGG